MSGNENSGQRPTPCELTDAQFLKILEMYSEGAANVEIKAYLINEIGAFSNNLWSRWMRDEPIFGETIRKGQILSEAWWTNKGRKGLEGGKLHYQGWYMQMKNRFAWTDTQKIENSHTFVQMGRVKVDGKELTFNIGKEPSSGPEESEE